MEARTLRRTVVLCSLKPATTPLFPPLHFPRSRRPATRNFLCVKGISIILADRRPWRRRCLRTPPSDYIDQSPPSESAPPLNRPNNRLIRLDPYEHSLHLSFPIHSSPSNESTETKIFLLPSSSQVLSLLFSPHLTMGQKLDSQFLYSLTPSPLSALLKKIV